jgi:hypothetical protein
MKKLKGALLTLSLIVVFLLVYSIHLNNPFPTHADEWHHITEAINFHNGNYNLGAGSLEIGFHIFLSVFLFVISNQQLVLLYKFFPAIWACFSALALFFLVYKKTNNNFWIALFSILFFASIKTNANTLGIGLFTPLTFAIPLIYLFIYFFTEGLEKESKKFILLSLGIMALLIPVHAISVLFAIPFLAVYSLFYLEYLKKEWKFFSTFLALPLLGLLFYKMAKGLAFSKLFSDLFSTIIFKQGWGVLEIQIVPTILYSIAGFTLALLGIIYIFKNQHKKYFVFLIWPATTLLSMINYFITKTSYLVPYQRNLYYFAISLPILSAMGLYYLGKVLNVFFEGLVNKNWREKTRRLIKIISALIILGIIFFFVFQNYWQNPKQIAIYTVINRADYDSLVFLSEKQKGVVMANPMLSEAIFPITGNNPVGTLYFYGNRKDADSFYSAQNCTARVKLIKKHDAKYVIAKSPINCNWTEIYGKTNYIYEIN